MLLIADERPLVERLGMEFFRQAPECPGVYLMRDASETVLYVGKAKNLRKSLGSYRIANPDRMRRRHLRLLRSVARIELLKCANESSALAKERALLQNLKPKFNRAGIWPGKPRFLLWRVIEHGLAFAIRPAAQLGWFSFGPLGLGAVALRAALVRLLWCALHPERGLCGMPEGWFHGHYGEEVVIPSARGERPRLEEIANLLENFCRGGGPFAAWPQNNKLMAAHPFESSVKDADLELVTEMLAPKAAFLD